MNWIFLAAALIGGTTLLGTACGFLLRRVSDFWNDLVTAFAAGVMLCAAAFGLFAPAMDLAQGREILLIPLGAALGAAFLYMAGAVSGRCSLRVHPELMFVLAIALHKFPEGMAGGISLIGMDSASAMTMVTGIALQNLPEGVVMIPPLLSAGVGKGRAAAIALFTGLLNAAGVFAGAIWGRMATGILPLTLCFAGGAMLYVILGNMIPLGCARRSGAPVALGGFVIMACVNALCG